jgi:nitronate monooxygenase
MIETALTRAWNLRVPIVGAPMSPMAGGKLAAAITAAGGLGMIGVGAMQPPEQLERDASEAGPRFGIGLMTWAVERRPELLETAIRAKPFAIAMSFGDPTKSVAQIHASGIVAVAQVQDLASARVAEAAGIDVLVAQGSESGGHTGGIGTLPLLQLVLDRVRVPVIAAGGIATGRGLAAVIACGAVGAWIGTPFLVADEARNTDAQRARILAARETETVQTNAFDAAQRIPWPSGFPGRALKNDFTARWHGRETEMDDAARAQFAAAKQAEDYATAVIYAGQSVGMLERVEPAAAIVERIAREAEARLRS